MVTRTKLAAELGIGERAVRKLAREGMPTGSVAAARRWREANIATPEHTGYSAARTRLAGARARLVELEVEKQAGDLANVDMMVDAACAVFLAARSRLFAVPADIAPLLAELSNPRDVERELRRALASAYDVPLAQIERAVMGAVNRHEKRRRAAR